MIRNLDIDLLRSFLTIYEARSFSHAADRLGRTQSTISQQIKKLEELLNQPLFNRNNRNVNLTTGGEMLLPHARRMVTMNDDIFSRISGKEISGTVRLGAPEAFAVNHLKHVLIQFSKSHPTVSLEVSCDLSHNLLEGFEKGDFDIVLFKRSPNMKTYGKRIWHETMVWACSSSNCPDLDFEQPIPLALSPYPCVYREKMVHALVKNNIKWNAVFTSASMTGRIAATKAGLGVTAIPKELLARYHDLKALDEASGMPAIDPIEIAILENSQTETEASSMLAQHIVFSIENNPSLTGKA